MDRPPTEPTPVDHLPSREFELEGKKWIVRVTGRGSVGSSFGSDAQLVHLSFFRAETPNEPHAEVLERALSLEDLSEGQATELLLRARAPRPPGGSEDDVEPRKGRRGRSSS